MSIIRKIKDYYKKSKRRILFTTPSHSQGEFIAPAAQNLLGRKFFKSDFSEIEGFDNLRHPQGVIKKLQQRLSEIYCSKQTFMLTNGSSSGVIAAMLSILKDNDKVLIARNCHISVYNGLVLTGAKPLWFMPEYDEEWDIYKGVKACDIERVLKTQNGIKALIITSPTYEGLFSDIEGISAVCKKHNILLIVDEAHGALLNFGDFGAKPAILRGADISIQSLHKTAGAPNPCALIHISKNSRADAKKIQNALNLINTTSPSYPLLCAIEAYTEFLSSKNGQEKLKQLLNNINELKKSSAPDIMFYEGFNDKTKLLIKIKDASGSEISKILNEKFDIEEEYSTKSAMLFITGIGTEIKKLRILKNALKKISRSSFKYCTPKTEKNILPEVVITPRIAYQAENSISIDINDAENKISLETIVMYPPGIPVIVAGEKITRNLIKIIKSKAKKNKIKVLNR